MRTLLHPAGKVPPLSDVALLVSRVALGVILLAHGWQKLTEWTVAGTAQSFEDMGIPVPTVSAYFVTGVEVLGGAALVVGLFTPVVAILNMVNMLGALVLVHAENGIFVDNGGYELVLALFAGLATIAVLGGGRFSADGMLGRSARPATEAGRPDRSTVRADAKGPA
jgi:putative oxidoreductase